MTHLTSRERQILELLCEGLSNKGIARQLGMRDSTVKVHLHNMFMKFDIHSRMELAMKKGRELYRSRPSSLIGHDALRVDSPQGGTNERITSINGGLRKEADESPIARINGGVE